MDITSNQDIARSTEAYWGGDGLIDEIWAERKRQIEQGYTHAHDDEHGAGHIIEEVTHRLNHPTRYPTRVEIVQSLALLVAAIETLDRTDD